MQRVYIAQDPLDGNMLKSFLESHGIAAHVQDERTHSLHGEVPFVYPSVWVRDEDLEEARRLVERYETEQRKPPENEAEWTCPTCGEKHSSKYTECWKCTPQEKEEEQEDPNGGASPPSSTTRLVTGVIIALVLVVVGFFIFTEARRDSAEQHMQTAIELSDKKRWNDALAEFDEVIRIVPDHWEAHCRRGYVLLDLERGEEALRAFEESVRIEPNKFTFYGRASAYEYLRRWKEAEQDCSAAIEVDPGFMDAYLLRGVVRSANGEFDDARRDYSHIVNRDEAKTATFSALLCLSDLYYAHGQPNRAMTYLDQANDLGPITASLLSRHARLKRVIGLSKEAYSDLDKAMQKTPEATYIRLQRAGMLMDDGRLEEALKELEIEMTSRSEQLEAYLLKGMLLTRLDRTQDARKALMQAKQCNAKEAYDYSHRGYAQALLGDFDEALVDGKQACTEEPWSAYSEYWMACIYAARAASHPASENGRAQRQADTEQGLHHLQNALEKGLKHSVRAFSYWELGVLRKAPRFDELKVKYTPAKP